MEFSYTFLETFFWGIYLIAPILLLLFGLILVLGAIVGKIEAWNFFDAMYWSFITALTVGYGDIRPLHRIARVLAIFIALIGIMLTGIIVAITVQSATISFDKHADPIVIEQLKTEMQ